ncbi:Lrp/AsnC family transcriptional regulator [Streptomyces sp. BI20]|uniref:Lrp/AsnC family transcriptional regulator n=1 Tax=Streptomyces sp. BI20 TaxID=3403460 RepID=UPI003C72F40B
MQESRTVTPQAGPSLTLDALDQALVHALQISPRAPWSALAPVLGVDAGTVARRWQRLHEAGAAWVTCYPGPAMVEFGAGCIAFIEVDCANGGLLRAAEELAAQPFVLTVEHVTGARDLLLTVHAADLPTLSRWVTLTLGAMPDIVASRTHLAGTIHAEGSRWRFRSLSQEQVRRLAARAPHPATRSFSPGTVGELDRAISTELSVDARVSYAALAERLGAAPDTIRRRVNRLFGTGRLQARCEVARPLSEWPVAALLWAQAPPLALTEAAGAITGMREVRLCAAVTGRDNLLIVGWVRSVEDAHRFEARVAERAPQIAITDRAITLWPVKLSGHLLDQRGYRIGAVPLDPWGPMGSAAA